VTAPPLDSAFRSEWAGVLATLARRFGDLDLAEDATQDAFLLAAETWPRDGVPQRPGAWLLVTARNRALDRLRRDRRTDTDPELIAMLEAPVGEEPGALPDDRLRLVFACCHPALTLEARVALTLRLVGGLTTQEVAAAFLVSEQTVGQRLVRAKRKVRDAGIPIEVPRREDLRERIDGVLAVVYLVFNEGYAATEGERVVRPDLCGEAIRLGRLVHVLLPDDAEAAGLLALMLLHDARAAARVVDGRPVALGDQDRALWDRDRIAEGTHVLEAALRERRPGPYQLQAAIAALHDEADSAEATDWPQIAALYGKLAVLAPSPVVEVNRAVAVGMADGPRAGLAVLERVLAGGTLDGYAPLHAAHADLLERAGEDATAVWRAAAAATHNPLQRAEMERRAGES
jgi:RNA polymerase sigma-70 factor (ECF subfamily)